MIFVVAKINTARLLLKFHFAESPVIASRNVGGFLRLTVLCRSKRRVWVLASVTSLISGKENLLIKELSILANTINQL